MPRTLYDVLQSHPLASEAQLYAAWQRLADPLERAGGLSGASANHLNELNAAWAVLGNPAAREAYDNSLPASVFEAPVPSVVSARPLVDWRVGRLIVLIAILSLLAFGWSNWRMQADERAARRQAEAAEAQARARDAALRGQIESPYLGLAEAEARAEQVRRDEEQAREFDEARRRSDQSMAEREAAHESAATEAERLRREREMADEVPSPE